MGRQAEQERKMRVLYISEVQWLAQVSRKHLMVRRFPADWEVLFVSPINARRNENSFRLRTDAGPPRVHYTSLALPKPDSLLAPVRALTCALGIIGGHHLRGIVRSYRPDVVVCSFIWAASVVPYIRKLGIPVVYDCNDLHPEFYPSRPRKAREAFESLASQADEVVASSAYLRKACGRGIVIGNGVDLEMFAGRRPDPLPSPIARSALSGCEELVAYVGSIDARIDFDIISTVLERLAAHDRKTGLVCVGWILDVVRKRVEKLSAGFPDHVLFTGQKPYRELPGYLSHAAVGIAPFLVNERTEAINPNKLYMYSAMDMNVVSTPFSEEIRDLRESVFVAASPADFAGAVIEALGDDERRRAMRESIALGNSWDAKAKEFVRLLTDLVGKS
jgi:glycosyltransferase involved in cell wall biosynthesis